MESTAANTTEEKTPPAATPATGAPAQLKDPRYSVGSLTYTKAGLFMLFGWLLWGDFCFTVFEAVGGPGILGLYLQDNYQVSNFKLNLVFGVIPQIIAILVGPPLSFKSDRYRSRWGRRIPFMLFTAPLLCLFAAAIGFADQIIAFLKISMGATSFISPLTAGLLVIGFLVIGFTFFNEFVQNVYWYLFADVVPEAYMGRFIGLFRTVGSIASFLVNIYIMPHQLTHMRWIHIGVALLYFFGFGMMCLGVKEGEYPPPGDVTEKTTFWEKTRLYFRECFSHRIFVMIYLTTFLGAVSGIMAVGGIFGLHVSQHQRTIAAHAAGPAALAVSGDGKYAISGGADGLLKLWNYRGKKDLAPLKSLAAHKAAITCAAISADGATAASGAADGQTRIWKVATGECLRTLPAGQGELTSLALFHDGNTLLDGTSDGKMHVWNLNTGELTRTLDAHSAAINCIALSSDEKLMATGSSDKTIALWNTADWSRARVLPGTSGPVYALCFAPSLEATSANAPGNGLGLKFGPRYFKEVFTNESLYDDALTQARVVTQDAWLLSGGRDGNTDQENSALCLWEISDGRLLKQLKGHKGAVTSIQFKRDLNLIISGSHDKSIRIWNPADISDLADDQSLRAVSGYTTAVTAIACQPRGPFICNADDKGELHLWDVDQGVSLKKGGLKGSFFAILAIVLAFPTGMLVDRFHPLRVTIFATLLIGPTQMAYYFFVHDYTSMVWLDCIKVPLYCLLGAAAMPLSMQLFPKSKYGQFCAAASTIRSAVVAAGGVLGALAMDWLTNTNTLTDNFRYGYLWLGAAYLLIFGAWLLVHREWKKLGGDKYVAPES